LNGGFGNSQKRRRKEREGKGLHPVSGFPPRTKPKKLTVEETAAIIKKTEAKRGRSSPSSVKGKRHNQKKTTPN